MNFHGRIICTVLICPLMLIAVPFLYSNIESLISNIGSPLELLQESKVVAPEISNVIDPIAQH